MLLAAKRRRLRPMMLSPAFEEWAHASILGHLLQSGSYVITSGMLGVLWAGSPVQTYTY